MPSSGRLFSSAVIGGILAALYALEFELGSNPARGTSTLLGWAAGGGLAGLIFAALVDLPLVPEPPQSGSVGNPQTPDKGFEPRVAVRQPPDAALHQLLVTPPEADTRSWSTTAATVCLVVVSIGLGFVGADWSSVALRLMSATGSDFWWGLDGMVWVIVGFGVLTVALIIVAAGFFGVYIAHGLLHRTARARGHAMYVLVIGVLVFFARAYSSQAVWIAGMAIGVGGGILLLLPATSADFEQRTFGPRWK